MWVEVKENGNGILCEGCMEQRQASHLVSSLRGFLGCICLKQIRFGFILIAESGHKT